MKNKGRLATGVFIAMLGAALIFNTMSTIGAQPDVKVVNISAKDALDMIAGEKDVLILDVRTAQEFDGPLGHLDGASLIPVTVLEKNIDKLEPYKHTKILLVCRTGIRSTTAASILSKRGFDNLYNLSGGMLAVRKIAPL